MRKTFLLIFNVIIFYSSYSQRASFEVEKISIGDQIKFTLEISKNKGKIIKFPILENVITEGIEILDVTEVINDEKSNRLYQEYLITSFEDSLFLIYPFEFNVDGKIVKTNPVRLEVKYYKADSALISKIDTTQQLQIADIKDPIDAPFTFHEFIKRFWVYVLIILLMIVVYFTIKYILKRKKEGAPILIKPKPKIPAHIVAYEKLEKLKKEESHKKIDLKPFYTQLSNIIRLYMEDRFKIPALESVTSEIMDAFNKSEFSNEEIDNKLKELLSLSDMVKFAKNKPDEYENELMFEYAYSFIDNTKQKEYKEELEVITKHS